MVMFMRIRFILLMASMTDWLASILDGCYSFSIFNCIIAVHLPKKCLDTVPIALNFLSIFEGTLNAVLHLSFIDLFYLMEAKDQASINILISLIDQGFQ